ncbi:hypothetical protein JCM1840_000148 [Sporobolomyces johnsonii]
MASEPLMLPDVLVQLKFVIFSWPNNQLLKKDPLARTFFRNHVTLSSFASLLGGFPLTLYEASLASSPTELFLSADQCAALINKLAESMGQTRASQSWKPAANHSRESLQGSTGGGIRSLVFRSQAELERRFAHLKDLADWAETRKHWEALKRAQDVWKRVQEGAIKAEMAPVFLAIDIETFESDHDVVTEVGFSKLEMNDEGWQPLVTEHFVVEENAQYRNGRFCPDARDYFHFGASTLINSQKLRWRLQDELLMPGGPIFLFLHDARSDVKSLNLLGVNINTYERASPLPPPDDPVYVEGGAFLLDTQHLFSGFSRRKKQIRLQDACETLGVVLDDGAKLAWHNSGNDAWATLQVFLKLMKAELGTAEAALRSPAQLPPPNGNDGR